MGPPHSGMPARAVRSRVSPWPCASSKPPLPRETESLGAELAAGLRDGDVVLVGGELGSGKTTLVRGAARALGVTDPVTSPTFSIGHRYRAARPDRLPPRPLSAGGTWSRGPGAARRLPRAGPDRLRGVARAGRRRSCRRAPAGDPQPRRGESPARSSCRRMRPRRRAERGMIVLGFDTATASTTVGLRLADGSTLAGARRSRHRRASRPRHPAAGHGRRAARRGGHRLERARPHRGGAGRAPSRACGWGSPRRVGSRSRCSRAGRVSSLRALAERGCTASRRAAGGVLAVIDARRGEVFAAAYERAVEGSPEELVPPRALAPEDSRASSRRPRRAASSWRLARGGRRGDTLSRPAASRPAWRSRADASPLHRVSAQAICDLGARAPAVASARRSCPTTGAARMRRSLWRARGA